MYTTCSTWLRCGILRNFFKFKKNLNIECIYWQPPNMPTAPFFPSSSFTFTIVFFSIDDAPSTNWNQTYVVLDEPSKNHRKVYWDHYLIFNSYILNVLMWLRRYKSQTCVNWDLIILYWHQAKHFIYIW